MPVVPVAAEIRLELVNYYYIRADIELRLFIPDDAALLHLLFLLLLLLLLVLLLLDQPPPNLVVMSRVHIGISPPMA